MGYLERRRDPADGRARLTVLTAKGQALMEYMYSASREIADEWAGVVGAERLEALRGTLLDLVDARREKSPP